jgi:hypothetical protein
MALLLITTCPFKHTHALCPYRIHIAHSTKQSSARTTLYHHYRLTSALKIYIPPLSPISYEFSLHLFFLLLVCLFKIKSVFFILKWTPHILTSSRNQISASRSHQLYHVQPSLLQCLLQSGFDATTLNETKQNKKNQQCSKKHVQISSGCDVICIFFGINRETINHNTPHAYLPFFCSELVSKWKQLHGDLH